MLDSKLVEVLVCPVSKTSLIYQRERDELWCRASRLAYPVKDGVPVMMESAARPLEPEEYESL